MKLNMVAFVVNLDFIQYFYQVVGMLETAYEMIADYYIELGSHTVEHRYVSLKSLIHCLM